MRISLLTVEPRSPSTLATRDVTIASYELPGVQIAPDTLIRKDEEGTLIAWRQAYIATIDNVRTVFYRISTTVDVSDMENLHVAG